MLYFSKILYIQYEYVDWKLPESPDNNSKVSWETKTDSFSCPVLPYNFFMFLFTPVDSFLRPQTQFIVQIDRYLLPNQGILPSTVTITDV